MSQTTLRERKEASRTSKEDKAINANLQAMFDTDFVDQSFHIPQTAEGSHEIAISVSTLAYIARRRAVDVELRLLEDILNKVSEHPQRTFSSDTCRDSLHALWLHRIAWSV